MRHRIVAAWALAVVTIALLSWKSPLVDAQDRGPDELPDLSLYHLDGQWERHDGIAMSLGELRGGMVVVTMFYSTCRHTCPLIVADLRRIERALADRRAMVSFVLVTLAPDIDTVERLAEFATATGLDAPGWHLLRGSPDAIRDLAAALDVRYRETGEAEVAHSNVITLLDEEGVPLAHHQAGDGQAEQLARIAEQRFDDRSSAVPAPPSSVIGE